MELVQELENIPLAITQAAAYINQMSHVTINMYLVIFRRSNENQAALLNKGRNDMRRDSEMPNAVFTSWELSFKQIRAQSAESADLLSLMAYFNRRKIPQFLLGEDDDAQSSEEVGDFSFNEHMNPLLSFSLVRAEIGNQDYEMHRHVQTATRHWLQHEGSEPLWQERAIERVARHFPSHTEQRFKLDWLRCETLMNHAEEVLLHTANTQKGALCLVELLPHTARYILNVKGNSTLAKQRSLRAMSIQQRLLGEIPDAMVWTVETLAWSNLNLKLYSEAIRLGEFFLSFWREDCDSERQQRLVAMQNLVMLFGASGQNRQEASLLKWAHRIAKTYFPPHGAENVSCVILLAQSRLKEGKFKEAEDLCRGVLDILEQHSYEGEANVLAAKEIMSGSLLA